MNPIFDEEEDNILKSSGQKLEFLSSSQRRLRKGHGSPEFQGKSGSSGYDSNRYNSSSEYSSSGAEESPGNHNIFAGSLSEEESSKARIGEPRSASLRDDAITVLEQNAGFVKSILVAVRGSGANASPRTSIGRHIRRPSGTSAATLTPIPEGKVDYTIPRPVWPKDDRRRKYEAQLADASEFGIPHGGAPDSIVDDALLLYTSFTYTPSLSPDGDSRVAQDGNLAAVYDYANLSTLSQITGDKHAIASHEILKELSNSISEALQSKQTAAPEVVLKGISETINSKLDALKHISRTPSSEEALRNLSVSLSHREPLTKMSRALSNSSSSSGGSLRTARDDVDTARILLLQRARLNKASVKHEDVSRTSASTKSRTISVDELLPPGGSSSSSTSSGFSDLTQTPASSSDSPSSQRGCEQRQTLAQPPVFLLDDLSSVPNSVRNAMIYGTLCRLNTRSASNSAYEKLLTSQKNGASEKEVTKNGVGDAQSMWEVYSGTGVTTGDVRLKPSDSYYYVSTTYLICKSHINYHARCGRKVVRLATHAFLTEGESSIQNLLLQGKRSTSGLAGLGVMCSPRDPWFAISNPAEVDEFFQDVKILSTSPPGGTLNWGP